MELEGGFGLKSFGPIGWCRRSGATGERKQGQAVEQQWMRQAKHRVIGDLGQS